VGHRAGAVGDLRRDITEGGRVDALHVAEAGVDVVGFSRILPTAVNASAIGCR
jgi:hypothetical protein